MRVNIFIKVHDENERNDVVKKLETKGIKIARDTSNIGFPRYIAVSHHAKLAVEVLHQIGGIFIEYHEYMKRAGKQTYEHLDICGDGKTVSVNNYIKQVLPIAKAVCSKNDTYSFEYGALLALMRAFPKEAHLAYVDFVRNSK